MQRKWDLKLFKNLEIIFPTFPVKWKIEVKIESETKALEVRILNSKRLKLRLEIRKELTNLANVSVHGLILDLIFHLPYFRFLKSNRAQQDALWIKIYLKLKWPFS